METTKKTQIYYDKQLLKNDDHSLSLLVGGSSERGSHLSMHRPRQAPTFRCLFIICNFGRIQFACLFAYQQNSASWNQSYHQKKPII